MPKHHKAKLAPPGQGDASTNGEKALVPEKQKFSDLITTPVIRVTVSSTEDEKTFFIHEGLLCQESEKFVRQLKGGFKEAVDKAIEIHDEDPNHFGFFVRYLYDYNGKFGVDEDLIVDITLLPRLYSMGGRLDATVFQETIFSKFSRLFKDQWLTTHEICDLLEICTEIPERVKEDPLRDLVFWYAAGKLEDLQACDRFPDLLEMYPDLGRHLCMRAGNSRQHARPIGPIRVPPCRFERENMYR